MRALVVSLVLALSSIAFADGLRVDIAPQSTPERVVVVLTNTSDHPVRVFREAYSWGYYGVTFELTTPDGKTVTMRKLPRGWAKNVPAFDELAPGGKLELDETLDEDEWALPKISGAVTLRAVYAIEPDAQSRDEHVWTGSIRSASVAYVWPMNGLLHIEIAAGSKSRQLEVVLTNVGSTPLKVFREDCSWGYGAVSLEAMTRADGKLVMLAKKPRPWTANVPIYDTLAPGASTSRKETLTPDAWELRASGKAYVRAIFTVAPDEISRQLGAWTGTTRSQRIAYTLP